MSEMSALSSLGERFGGWCLKASGVRARIMWLRDVLDGEHLFGADAVSPRGLREVHRAIGAVDQ